MPGFWERCTGTGSVPLTTESDPDPAIFISDLQDGMFFCLLPFEGTFTSFFKDKKSQRSRKTVGIKVFSYNFCLVIEGYIYKEAQKHTDQGSGSVPLTKGSGSATLHVSVLC
jgi:hypothetical protein